MIKLQDFAKQQGVTDRAVQKHLNKYAEELEGLYQRKGPNGTWLTDEACEILRSKMKQAPVTIITPTEQEGDLLNQIRVLEQELYRTQKEYTAYVSYNTPLLQKASEQLALAERAGEYKERIGELEIQNADLNAEITDAKTSLSVLKAANDLTVKELEGAREEVANLTVQNRLLSADNDTAKVKIAEIEKEAQKASQELLDARKQFEDEKHLMQQEIEQLRNRKWYQLIFSKNK